MLGQLVVGAPQVAVLAYVLVRLLALHERQLSVLTDLRAAFDALRDEIRDSLRR